MNPAGGQVFLEIVKTFALLVMRMLTQWLRRRFTHFDADIWGAGIDLAFALLALVSLWRPADEDTARNPTLAVATLIDPRNGINLLLTILVTYLAYAFAQSVLKHLSIDPADVAIVVLTICVLIFFLLLTLY